MSSRLASSKISSVSVASHLRSPFAVWFVERLYLIVLFLSAGIVLANTSLAGPLWRLGLSFLITIAIWAAGFFFLYRPVRNLSDNVENESYHHILQFIAAIISLVVVLSSIFVQAAFGYPSASLWPLLIIPLFASVDKLESVYYFFFVVALWIATLVLQIFPQLNISELQITGIWSDLVIQVLALMLLALILRYLFISLKLQSADLNQLGRHDDGEMDHPWHKSGYSQYVLNEIISLTRSVFHPSSCELIFVNGRMDTCYRSVKWPEIQSDQTPTQSHFKPEGALLKTIETGEVQWEKRRANPRSLERLFLFLSELFPLPTDVVLYLPVREYRSSDEVIAVLKVHVRANIFSTNLWASWQDALKPVSRETSEMLKQRETVQALRTMEAINRIAVHSPSEKVYRVTALHFAYLFNCPVSVWAPEEYLHSPDTLKLITATNWLVSHPVYEQYKRDGRLHVGKGKIGNAVCVSSSELQIFSADVTEHAEYFRKFGVRSIVPLPLQLDTGACAIIVLHALSDWEFRAGEQFLIEVLTKQVEQVVNRLELKEHYKRIGQSIRKALVTTSVDRGTLKETLAQLAQDILGANGLVIISANEDDLATANRLAIFGESSFETNSPLPVAEESFLEKVILGGIEVFVEKPKTLPSLIPEEVQTCAILPISYADSVDSIAIVCYWNRRTFSSDYRLLHQVFTLLADYLLTIEHRQNQLRSNLADEERQRLSREVHANIKDLVHAIRNWADGAQLGLEQGRDYVEVSKPINKIGELVDEIGMRIDKLPDSVWSPDLSAIEKKGFANALKDYFASFGGTATLSLEINNFNSITVPISIQAKLYRLCRLALTNVVVHSFAQSVALNLEVEGSELRVCIVDDGIGFDDQGYSGNGQGIATMYEIAAEIGGNLNLNTVPKRGTKICLQALMQER